MDDNDIIELFLARDQSAISHTSQKYGERLRGTAHRILRDIHSAEECENDTYFQAWNLIPPNEPRSYLFPFLCRITRHFAIDRCRALGSAKRSARYCELTEELEEITASGVTAGETLEAAELGRAISAYLEQCSELQRNVFIRRYYFFDPISEICSRYGCSQSRVKTMLYRLRCGLRAHLEKEGYII